MKYAVYSEYKTSGSNWLDAVPSHWHVKPLKLIVKMPITDGPHETPEFIPDGVPFASVEAVWDGKVHLSSVRGYISEEDHRRYGKKYHPKRGDIFIVKSGSTTGKIAIVDFDDDFNVWSPLAAVRCDGSQAHPEFVFYALISSYFQRLVQVSWSFGTQPNIGMGVLGNLPAVLPPVAEQQTIARFLDTKTAQIDALVAQKRQLIAKLKEKRQALIARTVTLGLPPEAAKAAGLEPNPEMKDSGVDWLGQIASHWNVMRLRFLLSERLQYGANEAAELDDPELPRFVRITDVDDDGKLRPETFRSLPADVAKPFLLKDGDILFARSGATSGKTFLYKKEWGVCAHAGYLIRARLDQKRMNPSFLRFFTASDNYWQWVSLAFIQATIQNISAEKYADLWIPTPPVEEQRSIVDYLTKETSTLNGLMDKANLVIDRLTEYRQALITSAVTGKIDVRSFSNAHKEAA